jgi:hypothetical protein
MMTGAGTPSYMPFEQQDDGLSIDHTVDIYALAVMLFEMFTGQKPFRVPSGILMDEARRLLKEQHRSAPIPDITQLRPELPPPMNAIFRQALAKEPSERYLDVMEFARDVHITLLPLLPPDLRDFEEIKPRSIPEPASPTEFTSTIPTGLIVTFGLLSIAAIVILVYIGISWNNRVTVARETEAAVLATQNAPTITGTFTITPSETPTLQPTPTDTEATTENSVVLTESTEDVPSATMTTEAAVISATEIQDTPTLTATPLPTATNTMTPVPTVGLVANVASLGLPVADGDENEIELLQNAIDYAAFEHGSLIPLRVGSEIRDFKLSVELGHIGSAITYGIAFRVQDEAYLLLRISNEAGTWEVIRVSLPANEDGNPLAQETEIAAGELLGAAPTTLTVSGIGDEFHIEIDSLPIDFTAVTPVAGGLGLWIEMPALNANDDLLTPRIVSIRADLLGMDAQNAEVATPTLVPSQINPHELLLDDIRTLISAANPSQPVECTDFLAAYDAIETHKRHLERLLNVPELVPFATRAIESARIINNRCLNGGPGATLNQNDNATDLLTLESGLNRIITDLNAIR